MANGCVKKSLIGRNEMQDVLLSQLWGLFLHLLDYTAICLTRQLAIFSRAYSGNRMEIVSFCKFTWCWIINSITNILSFDYLFRETHSLIAYIVAVCITMPTLKFRCHGNQLNMRQNCAIISVALVSLHENCKKFQNQLRVSGRPRLENNIINESKECVDDVAIQKSALA